MWNGKGYDSNGQIVYEIKNGKGYIKKYFYGLLVFEGEFSNGEVNGKGKEYDKEIEWDDSRLLFEGEYLYGKRHGKGKDYKDGILLFEGEYKNGLKNVLGKTYYSNGRLWSRIYKW